MIARSCARGGREPRQVRKEATVPNPSVPQGNLAITDGPRRIAMKLDSSEADYLVLARKCRPQRFEDLVGQEHVTRRCGTPSRSGRVAHAFLFTGIRGVGKTTAARLLAKALNCERGPAPTAEPCNECSNCREIRESRSSTC